MTNESIAKQRVFVALDSVLMLQDRLRQADKAYRDKQLGAAYEGGFREGMREAIRILSLPIDVTIVER